jgi:3-hydroxymyristoyl/3-hydroxydecanoyl-(acyl carrier protein) dehydratase
MAIALILGDCPAEHLAGVDEVKFLTPVLPGDQVTVTCGEIARDRVAFACTVTGHTVLRGRARLRAAG